MLSYFNIRKDEYYPTLYGFLYSFLIVGFFILSKSVRNSLFLNNFSKQDLSYLYLVTPIITGLLVWLFLLFFKRVSLLNRSLFFHFLICVMSSFLLTNINETRILVYYILVEFQIAIVSIIFWDILSESFTNRQAKRLFVIITSGGFLSALIVGGSLPYITSFISQESSVILVNILILICPLFVYQIKKYSFNDNGISNYRDDSLDLFKDIFKNKYILNIVYITFLFTIISVIIDYNFKVISYDQFKDDPVGLTNYFARFYSIASFASFIIQITASGYIINRYGIKYALMILPILLLGVFISGYFISSFIVIVLLKGKEQIFKSTLHDTSMHILWMPIPSIKRLTIKPIINIILKNLFSSLAAGLLIISVYYNLNFQHFIPIVCLLLLLLIYLTRKTQDYYVQELIKAIDDRSLNLDDENLSFITDDSNMLNIIKSKLIDEKENRYFILHLLDKSIIEKCKDTLGNIFYDSDDETKKIILKYLKHDIDIISSDYLIEQVNSNNEMSVVCLNTLCQRNILNINKINIDLLYSKSDFLKFSAIDNCIKYGYDENKAISLIKDELIEANNLSILINYLSFDSYLFSKEEIIDSFSKLDYNSFLDSLKFINEKNCDQEVLDLIINKLHVGYYFDNKVYNMFMSLDKSKVQSFFEYKFLDKSVSRAKKIFISNIIKAIDDISYVSIYTSYINLIEHDYKLLENIFDSLIVLKSKDLDLFNKECVVNDITEKIIYSQYFDIKLLEIVSKDNSNYFIKEFYDNKISENSRLLMKMIYFYNNSLFKKNLNVTIFEKDLYLSKVIEIFEEYLPDHLKQKVIPLFDEIDISEKSSNAVLSYPEIQSLDLKTLYEDDVIYQDDWYMFIILADIIKKQKGNIDTDRIFNNRYFKLLFNDLNFNEDDIFNRSANETLYQIMITNLEKTLYLKDSNIFEGIPAKELIYIANSLEEISFAPNTSIFKDGDVGDSMYFIIKGAVDIIKGDVNLITLKKGDYFGEMALLDGESRSADANVAQESILLKLSANDFEKIMYSNDKIVKGILSMLSKRLRRANNLLNQNK